MKAFNIFGIILFIFIICFPLLDGNGTYNIDVSLTVLTFIMLLINLLVLILNFKNKMQITWKVISIIIFILSLVMFIFLAYIRYYIYVNS